MKVSPQILGFTWLLAGLTGCAGTSDDAIGLSSADSAALREMVTEDIRAVLAADWDALAGLYSEDAVRMPPNQPEVRGRPAIRAWFETLPPISSFTIDSVVFDGRGDLAYLAGRYTITIAVPDLADPVTDEGKVVWILRRQVDGSWRKVRDIWNSSLPVTG